MRQRGPKSVVVPTDGGRSLWRTRASLLASLASLFTGGGTKPGRAGTVGSWLFGFAGFMMALVLAACNGAGASSSPASTVSTLQVAQRTTEPRTITTAAPSTTTTPATTEATPSTTVAVRTAPPTTTVGDVVTEALTRAQDAWRSCLETLPSPCDEAKIDAHFVGAQRDYLVNELSQSGNTLTNVDNLTWTLLDGPTVVDGGEIAIAIICRYDPAVATAPDGTVDPRTGTFLQQWDLLPVDSTWKVSQVINLADPVEGATTCDEQLQQLL